MKIFYEQTGFILSKRNAWIDGIAEDESGRRLHFKAYLTKEPVSNWYGKAGYVTEFWFYRDGMTDNNRCPNFFESILYYRGSISPYLNLMGDKGKFVRQAIRRINHDMSDGKDWL